MQKTTQGIELIVFKKSNDIIAETARELNQLWRRIND